MSSKNSPAPFDSAKEKPAKPLHVAHEDLPTVRAIRSMEARLLHVKHGLRTELFVAKTTQNYPILAIPRSGLGKWKTFVCHVF